MKKYDMPNFKSNHYATVRIISLSFLAAILAGTVLLMLPVSTASGEWCPFLTALFTAATSVCVTGLVVVDTFSYWSLFGKVIILLLIQIGGLSVVILWAGIMARLHKRLGLRSRILIRDYLDLDNMQGISRFTKRIIRAALFVEGAGAFLYCLILIPQNGFLKGAGQAVFTSVSAFCNAGIDVFGPDSLIAYQSNLSMNVITMLLIITGGLGFFVWFDMIETFHKCRKTKSGPRIYFDRLQAHTRLVLSATLILIVSGTLLVLAGEFRNPSTIGGMDPAGKILASLFQSVTFRTAGFSTVPQQKLTPFTCIAGLFYMMIGGSPAGTAGGIKTVTVAILLLSAAAYIRQHDEVIIYGRRVSHQLVSKAIATVTVFFIIVILFTELLLLTNDIPPLSAAYEIFSALGTVGLSRALTGSLNTAGKVIVILAMYIGRIAPISMLLFFSRDNKNKSAVRHPEGRFLIG